MGNVFRGQRQQTAQVSTRPRLWKGHTWLTHVIVPADSCHNTKYMNVGALKSCRASAMSWSKYAKNLMTSNKC